MVKTIAYTKKFTIPTHVQVFQINITALTFNRCFYRKFHFASLDFSVKVIVLDLCSVWPLESQKITALAYRKSVILIFSQLFCTELIKWNGMCKSSTLPTNVKTHKTDKYIKHIHIKKLIMKTFPFPVTIF